MATQGTTTQNVAAPARTDAFDFDSAWDLHEQVQVRPERFGALLYHYGDRRLSFVKSPELRTTLELLASCETARLALHDAGVSPGDHLAHERALSTLARSNMIVPRQSEEQRS